MVRNFIRNSVVAGWLVGVTGLTGAAVVGCSAADSASSTEDSQTMWMQTEKTDQPALDKALASKMAVMVNLETNRATVYQYGKPVKQWNIASADVTGEFHDKIPQSTPTGVFAVEDMQICPTWLPRAPKDPKTGKTAENEQERARIFKENPDLFGPCGASNPLGSYVIWFHGEYGIHGNAAEWILELSDAQQRRVSGGCIRNPNSKIKDLFHLVLDSYPQVAGFRESVVAMENAPAKDKKTLTQSLTKTDMKVVVGRWPQDPVLNQSAPAPVQTPAVAVPVQTPVPQKLKCLVSGVDPVKQVAIVYTQLPANFDNEVTFYNRGDYAIVTEELAGTGYVRTTKGLLSKKLLSDCRTQN
jgi:hypothetical protein